MYNEIKGDLITLALEGKFDVICHGLNCFCNQGAGIALQMVRVFDTHTFPLEQEQKYMLDKDGEEWYEKTNYKGDINKLGQIDYRLLYIQQDDTGLYYKTEYVNKKDIPNYNQLTVVNAYTQYNYGANHKDGDKKPVDYEAIALCMKKINHIFKGKHVGLPMIGAGLAGGDWNRIKQIIQSELKDVDVTVVIYKK